MHWFINIDDWQMIEIMKCERVKFDFFFSYYSINIVRVPLCRTIIPLASLFTPTCAGISPWVVCFHFNARHFRKILSHHNVGANKDTIANWCRSDEWYGEVDAHTHSTRYTRRLVTGGSFPRPLLQSIGCVHAWTETNRWNIAYRTIHIQSSSVAWQLQ